MFIATVIVSAVLAAMIAFSAIRKLSHSPEVVASYARAGVPEDWLNLLAFTLLAGAGGVLVGLAWAPIGITAAASLSCYFGVAISFHLRNGDTEHAGTPVVVATLAVAALVLRLLTI